MNPWKQPRRWQLRQMGIAFVGSTVGALLFVLVATITQVAGVSFRLTFATAVTVTVLWFGGWYSWCYRRRWL